MKSGCCPRCRADISMSKKIFAGDFQCPRCGVQVYVSGIYVRTLVVLSALLGSLLVWAIGIRSIFSFCLVAPLALFPVLLIIIRVAPHVLRPTFALLKPGTFTTLRLGGGPGSES